KPLATIFGRKFFLICSVITEAPCHEYIRSPNAKIIVANDPLARLFFFAADLLRCK
ncbi:hypothetical protein S245_032124, partial [Arachis hypogaea]